MDSETCHVRPTQGRCLHDGWSNHGDSENIGLELQQSFVGRRATVHAQHGQWNPGIALHRVK
jgi:hypothetical protein